MAVSELEIRATLQSLQLEIQQLRIKQVLTWLMKHYATKKLWYERNRQTVHVLNVKLVADMSHKLKKREVRLIRSLVIGSALKLKLLEIMTQINEGRKATINIAAAKRRVLIDRYQRYLAPHSLECLKRTLKLNEDIANEQQNILMVKLDIKKEIESHKSVTQDLQKEKETLQITD